MILSRFFRIFDHRCHKEMLTGKKSDLVDFSAEKYILNVYYCYLRVNSQLVHLYSLLMQHIFWDDLIYPSQNQSCIPYHF